MTSQFDLDVMWLEAMEEIDEVESEFWETLDGKKESNTEEATAGGTSNPNQANATPNY